MGKQMPRITVRLTDDCKVRLQEMSEAKGKAASYVIRAAITAAWHDWKHAQESTPKEKRHVVRLRHHAELSEH